MNGKYYGKREILWHSREKDRLEHIQRKRRMANDEESNKQLQKKKNSPWKKRWQEREPLRLEHIKKERVSKNEKNKSKNHIHRSRSRHMA